MAHQGKILSRRPPTAHPSVPLQTASVHEPTARFTDEFSHCLLLEMNRQRRYAVRLSNDVSLADDLIQTAFLKAWLARSQFRPGSNFAAWCRTIVRNEYFAHIRRNWRLLPLEETTEALLQCERSDPVPALELLALRNAIRLLPEEQRTALLLIAVGGFSYTETASMCDCEVGTIKSRVSRARLKLVGLLAEKRVGYSCDPTIRACEVTIDLMRQVASITSELDAARCQSISSPDFSV